MAKKTNRVIVFLSCPECGRQNYTTNKNKTNAQVKKQGKLELNKYCSFCKKVTAHKEAKVTKGKSRKTGK